MALIRLFILINDSSSSNLLLRVMNLLCFSSVTACALRLSLFFKVSGKFKLYSFSVAGGLEVGFSWFQADRDGGGASMYFVGCDGRVFLLRMAPRRYSYTGQELSKDLCDFPQLAHFIGFSGWHWVISWLPAHFEHLVARWQFLATCPHVWHFRHWVISCWFFRFSQDVFTFKILRSLPFNFASV